MKPALLLSTLILTLPAAFASTAFANAFRPNPALKSAAVDHNLVDGELTMAPMGFVRFCLDNPRQCVLAGEDSVELNEELSRQLAEVNSAVNRRIAPKADAAGEDRWSLGVTSGDCDDYAVQKRAQLIERGWPAKALSLAAVRTSWGEDHLVLTVRAKQGDLVLDNLTEKITYYNETDYRWIRRQSKGSPLYWVKLSTGNPVPSLASAAKDRVQ